MARSETATVRSALDEAAAALAASDIPSPSLDAEVLLAHILGWNRARLFARPEYGLSKEQRQRFQAALSRRRDHEPVAYIVGVREFFGLEFFIDRRVLIPRPETELLVERVLEAATASRHRLGEAATASRHVLGEAATASRHRLGGTATAGRITLADVGTGSGVVAVSLTVSLPEARVYATDVSSPALEVAALNCQRHGVADRVHLLAGDLLEPVPEPVDIIAANLPYIPAPDLATLAHDVTQYEPLLALDGGPDGLAQISRFLEQAGRWLLPGGVAVLEIGAGQGVQVTDLARRWFPAARIDLFLDYAGLDRVVRIMTPGA
jgi:release factor glutamine methyltransferase